MYKYTFILLLCLLQPLLAAPPPVPSAGVVEREIEKEYESKPIEPDKQVPSVQIDIPKQHLEMPIGRKIRVDHVEIEGNTAFSEKEITSWISTYLHRELSMKDIYAMCAKIDEEYARRGYFLARAYPPPQTVDRRTLRIAILEGKLGCISVIGNKHYSKEFIAGYFAPLQNKPLRYDKFLEALMLLNENSDLAAGAVFEKGQDLGCADVVLRVYDKRPVHLYLNANNYGKDLTTNIRAGGRLDIGSLLKQGDKFSFAGVIGFPVEALYFTDAIYNIPLNKRGSSLEFAYLFSKFHIEELTSLHLKGRSDIATVKFNQALTRTRSLSLDFFSYFDYKQIQNIALGETVSFDKLRVLTAGLLFDHFTSKSGRDYLTIEVAAGIPGFLGGLKTVDSRSSRIGGGGRFFIFNADYDRLQHLPYDTYFYFHGSGQVSFNKLTLPEQLYIGGADTVRGYPLAVALGDSGYYLNFEYRFPLPKIGESCFFRSGKKWKDILQFDLFLDQGGAFLNEGKNLFLCGTGFGLKINGPYTIGFSIDVGFPLIHRDLSKVAFTYMKLVAQPF